MYIDALDYTVPIWYPDMDLDTTSDFYQLTLQRIHHIKNTHIIDLIVPNISAKHSKRS